MVFINKNVSQKLSDKLTTLWVSDFRMSWVRFLVGTTRLGHTSGPVYYHIDHNKLIAQSRNVVLVGRSIVL